MEPNELTPIHLEFTPVEQISTRSTTPRASTSHHQDEASMTAGSQTTEVESQDDSASSKDSPPLPDMWMQWWEEILSCILMIGMLGAIVGVLYPNNGKPLPEWPFHVSINTAISILSTILKACAAFILAEGISDSKWKWFRNDKPLHDLVVFDNASRGPWGCFKLLIAPRGMHPVASLGAALAILVLALDPFTQQLLHYYDCRQNSTEATATLPRSTMYSEAAVYLGVGVFPPATPMLGFIDQGLYNPADVKTPFVCVTGNCTFDNLFSTLGFCATCEDMSSKLTFTNETLPQIYINLGNNTTYTKERLWVNTTLPSGLYAAAQPPFKYQHTESFFVMSSTDGWIEVIQTAMAFPGAVAGLDSDHYYVTAMRTHDQYVYPNITNCTDWACAGFGGAGAARCRVDPCVKTYKADIENGHLREELVRSQRMFSGNPKHGDTKLLAADLTCAGPEAVSRLQGAGFRVGEDDIVNPWGVIVNTSDGKASIPTKLDITFSNINIPGPLLNETDLPLDIIPADCIYSMNSTVVVSIQGYLRTYLSGSLVTGSERGSFDGPPQLRAIFNDSYASFSSINRTFNSIAEGITQRIRSYGQPGALPAPQPAFGVVFEQKTCVDVRWQWLAFPSAVVALTTVFLFAVINRATYGPKGKAGTGWKSSPLPMVLDGLMADLSTIGSADGDARLKSLKEMERIAKATTAKLYN